MSKFYDKEREIAQNFYKKVRKKRILNENLKREVEREEISEEIEKFQSHFNNKNITASFEFGEPQKMTVNKNGVLWSGRINTSINWLFNASLNVNERGVYITIPKDSRVELEDNSLKIFDELKTYFELFVDDWINKEFNQDNI